LIRGYHVRHDVRIIYLHFVGGLWNLDLFS